jgi:hypothetical protein
MQQGPVATLSYSRTSNPHSWTETYLYVLDMSQNFKRPVDILGLYVEQCTCAGYRRTELMLFLMKLRTVYIHERLETAPRQDMQ